MARLGVPIGGQGRRLARARPNQTIGEQQMCSNDLNQWTARTAAVHALFPTWSAEVRCLDLAEEAVQLASGHARKFVEGHAAWWVRDSGSWSVSRLR